MVIAHKGEKFHSDRLSYISLLLDDSGSLDDDLEPFIVGWETFQKNQYAACGVQYDNSTCKLNSTRRLGISDRERSFRYAHTKETKTFLHDLEMREIELNDRKMSQDYLFPYRLVHKSGPGVSTVVVYVERLIISDET